jgi:NodT family efflux transporter outer membrane factor (OMF) lipoprotein
LAPGFQRTQNQFDINLSASWELDLAGGLARGREAVAYDYQAAQADGAAARLSVAGQVSDAYIQLRGFQQRLLIAEQQAGVADRIARLVTLREQAGEAARRERDQAEATAAAARAAAPALRAGVEAQTNRLLVLLGGLPQSRRSDLDAPALLPSAMLAEAGAPADLLRRRPDLIVAERRLAATHARVGVALAEYYPSFSLSAVVGQQYNFLSSLTKGGANMLQGAVGLRWRLFDFGRIDAEVAQARGVEREALAAYRQAVLRASEEVETRYSALIEAQAQAAALGVQIEALERARLSTEKGWTAGEVSLIELLQAERDLLSARLAQMDAMEASGRNWVAVRLALGG